LRRKFLAVAALAAMLLTGSLMIARADTEHGAPDCSQPFVVDEPSFGSRDGFDHFHVSNPAVFASLAELEGFLNVCRTNDATIAEAVSASARVVRVSGVVRVQLRAQLQRHFDPEGPQPESWYTLSESPPINTGDNRTLTVITDTLDEVDSDPPHEHDWYRVNIRALVRYSNGSLVFYIRSTYPVWLGDGPVTPIPA
jgi:hypothetical protein